MFGAKKQRLTSDHSCSLHLHMLSYNIYYYYILQHPQQPAQTLIFDHRNRVEEGVCATHSQEHQETVCSLVSVR